MKDAMVKALIGDNQSIEIVGDATIYEAEALHAALVALPSPSGESVTLDLSRLQALDVAGLQILVTYRRHLRPRELHVVNVPPHIQETLRLGGLDAHLR